MKATGVVLAGDELDRVKTLAAHASATPVVGYGATGLVTMSQMAWKDANEAVNAIAVTHGLPDGSFYYSLSHAGELLVPDGCEGEFDGLVAAIAAEGSVKKPESK